MRNLDMVPIKSGYITEKQFDFFSKIIVHPPPGSVKITRIAIMLNVDKNTVRMLMKKLQITPVVRGSVSEEDSKKILSYEFPRKSNEKTTFYEPYAKFRERMDLYIRNFYNDYSTDINTLRSTWQSANRRRLFLRAMSFARNN